MKAILHFLQIFVKTVSIYILLRESGRQQPKRQWKLMESIRYFQKIFVKVSIDTLLREYCRRRLNEFFKRQWKLRKAIRYFQKIFVKILTIDTFLRDSGRRWLKKFFKLQWKLMKSVPHFHKIVCADFSVVSLNNLAGRNSCQNNFSSSASSSLLDQPGSTQTSFISYSTM